MKVQIVCLSRRQSPLVNHPPPTLAREREATYGPSLKKLGTHPLNIHSMPSAEYASPSTRRMLCLPAAFITRVLMTSTGLVTVAATTPARKLAVKWHV